MPYPDYLGAEMVHVAFLTYPSEGAEVQVSLALDGSPITQENINITAGSAPVAYNISCQTCYVGNGTLSVTAALTSDLGTIFNVQKESAAITSLTVKNGADTWIPAKVTATFSGLVPGETYSLCLWCNSPALCATATLNDGSNTSIDYDAEPGICSTTRYLTLTSSDGAHIIVASA